MFKFCWFFKTLLYRFLFKRIGYNSYVAGIVFLYGGRHITIQNKVRIFPGLRMEAHNGGSIVIQKDTSIGQNFHVTSSNEELVIGAHSTISGNVFITNIDHDYKKIDTHILKQKFIVQKTLIGENCFIGYGAAIQAGTILGKHCVVGANSVVRGIFPDYSVIVGAPAHIIKRYCFKTHTWKKTNAKGDFVS